jgi:hypothetical protein
MTYESWFAYAMTALEVDGECYLLFRTALDDLRKATEQHSNGKYSVRMCADKSGYCEAYIVK